jgi:ABC-type transporter Mla subunit MlaD
VSQHLRSDANEVERTLTNLADQVSTALTTRVSSLSEGLQNDTAAMERTLTGLAEQVSATLVARASEVATSHETLRKDVNGVLEQLNAANTLLGSVLEEVKDNLGPIEGVVGERIAAFRAALDSATTTSGVAVERIDHQVRELREFSTVFMRDATTLTQRFEDQGKSLSGAAEQLEATHRRIDATLAERRDAIEQITSALSNRAADLEERLARFNKLMQESLTAAETRAQEIARLVAESTSQSTHAIARQYELLRSTTTEERERTSAALRATYEQAMDEVNSMFRETNSRFTEAARELREVADEVQRSLDQTRQELKRGVFELPNETRESAQAMRRVVADQIKALAELNDIVARQGRMASIAEPPPREEPTPQRRTREPVSGNGDGARRPAREEAPPARAGWFNGLTGRGSREPEARREEPRGERPLPPTLESFDALSIDISRMIDHDAAVEAWDRYKRGERNVFTRKLYTMPGQKAFEEIRRRYRRNGDFRETVDRYIDEFERLLDQVARDDRGQGLTKTYLTSDTGKVYTLLAHAASRLE